MLPENRTGYSYKVTSPAEKVLVWGWWNGILLFVQVCVTSQGPDSETFVHVPIFGSKNYDFNNVFIWNNSHVFAYEFTYDSVVTK